MAPTALSVEKQDNEDDDFVVVPAVQKKLMLHHERRGDYADAEDVLFELVEL